MSETTSDWYRSLKGYKWATKLPMSCAVVGLPTFDHKFFHCNGRVLYVRTHYAWDGASGPAIDGPTNMRPTLFHDVLCQAIEEGLLDKVYRKYADELLRTHMLEDQRLYADGLLPLRKVEDEVIYSKEMYGLKRSLYLRWGKFRANGYYQAVRAYSRLKGM